MSDPVDKTAFFSANIKLPLVGAPWKITAGKAIEAWLPKMKASLLAVNDTWNSSYREKAIVGSGLTCGTLGVSLVLMKGFITKAG